MSTNEMIVFVVLAIGATVVLSFLIWNDVQQKREYTKRLESLKPQMWTTSKKTTTTSTNPQDTQAEAKS